MSVLNDNLLQKAAATAVPSITTTAASAPNQKMANENNSNDEDDDELKWPDKQPPRVREKPMHEFRLETDADGRILVTNRRVSGDKLDDDEDNLGDQSDKNNNKRNNMLINDAVINQLHSSAKSKQRAALAMDNQRKLLLADEVSTSTTATAPPPETSSASGQLRSLENHFKGSKQHIDQHKDSESLPKPSKGRLKQFLILILFIIGLIVCVTSIICILLLPTFVTNQISKRLVLKNNSLLLDRWSKPNVPMFFKVWLFDIKNARELIDHRGARPILEEVGPFVFDMRRQKDVISFAGDNLYYTERKVYHFNRELSCCSINTTVTVANIPLVAVVDRALGYNLPLLGRFIPRLINRAIQSLREQLFIRKQVGELLFDGYEVDLLKMVSRIGSIVGLPQQSQRFGLLKGRNNTWRPDQDGVFAINTGASDRHKFGRVSSWNSYKQLPFWPSSQCNIINGSDGTLFPPPISREQPLYIFNPELCRTVNLVYNRPSQVQSIEAYRFILNPLNFAHTMSPRPPVLQPTLAAASQAPSGLVSGQQQLQQQLAPNNNLGKQEKSTHAARPVNEKPPTGQINPQTCFCDRRTTKLGQTNICEFDGLIDLSRCSKQAQVVFGSMPHFHQGDSRLLNQVSGLQPNASKHTTYLDIEPNTGLVLGGKRRVQLNLLIKHNNEVDGFENIQDMLVPLVWFEESAQITEESAKKFQALYTDRIRLINLALISLFVASLVLLLIDARLLLASRYWRQFKLFNGPGNVPLGGEGNFKVSQKNTGEQPTREANLAAKASHKRHQRAQQTNGAKLLRDTADRRQDRLGETVSATSLGSSSSLYSLSSIAGHYEPLATIGQSKLPRSAISARRIRGSAIMATQNETETDKNSAKRSDSPLLEPTSCSSDTESLSSGSPEPRNWPRRQPEATGHTKRQLSKGMDQENASSGGKQLAMMANLSG